MKSPATFFLLFIAMVTAHFGLYGQSVFSEKELDYKKAFLPYDVSYTYPLPAKEFVMLCESKKNVMLLGRYDEYYFDKWETVIEFDKDQNVPAMFVRRDTAVIYNFTPVRDKNKIQLTFRLFNIQDGAELKTIHYDLPAELTESSRPALAFSEDLSKFVVYNYQISSDGELKSEYRIFHLGHETPIKQFRRNPAVLAEPKACKVQLSNNGDLFLAVVDPVEFKAETYYWRIGVDEPVKSSSNFFFERPPEKIGEIDILRQGASSYFITFTGNIENELIGFGILGVNVVLKTVMFTHNQNINREAIADDYKDFILTSDKQKGKFLEIPEALTDFRLVQTFENEKKDVIVVLEQLEIPTGFHDLITAGDLTWRFKSKQDKFYYGGDLVMYCFTNAGIRQWTKAVQKSQFSQANSLGLSYLPFLKNNVLSLLCSESAKDGNFYVLKINTTDGTLVEKINLLPDKKLEWSKKYSCWLNANSVIVCGISANNTAKRNLMLVEF